MNDKTKREREGGREGEREGEKERERDREIVIERDRERQRERDRERETERERQRERETERQREMTHAPNIRLKLKFTTRKNILKCKRNNCVHSIQHRTVRSRTESRSKFKE